MDEEKLFRYFHGEATLAEKDAIMAWVEASEANRKEFRKMHLIYAGLALYAPKTSSHRSTFKLVWANRTVRYVARLAAVIMLMVGSYYIGGDVYHDSLTQQEMKIVVARGQRVEVVLADSTHVQLNSGTTLEYPAVFAKDMRRVKLSGEALFDVKHDEKQPFVVETYACDVKVLGTKFNVLANDERQIFSTALLRGKIAVKNRASGQEIIATPNMRIDLKNGEFEVSHMTNLDNYLWADGIISVGGLSFEELIYKLETCYDVDIVMQRKTMPVIKYKALKIRVSDGIEHALEVLQFASNFNYEYDKEQNKITIK